MMSKIFFIRSVILSGLLAAAVNFQGCSILEPAVPAASYVHIDSISLTTDNATQGSNASYIPDAWVIYDNNFLGTFPLPADIPLIGEGTHDLLIKGGVIENGVAGTRSAYPKYQAYHVSVDLRAGEKVNLHPHIVYEPNSHFKQIEDFDDANLSMVSTDTTYAPLGITALNDPNSFEGNSGVVTVDASHTFFELASAVPYALPLEPPTYVELNYKSDITFSVGIFITSTAGILKTNLIDFRPTITWKKTYISLNDLGVIQNVAIDYKIILSGTKPSDQTSGKIYFDNLKVLY
jgi:hypothetical protein